MNKFIILLLSVCICIIGVAQNVGIGTSTPSEKLDVNGNLNVSGNILLNGVPGNPNQALITNSSGTPTWANMQEYKEHLTFAAAGSSSWTVPAGVTKILVEVWAAGGGGSTYAGGGGGGYISAYFTVTPGLNIPFTVGEKGLGNITASTTTNHGTNSTVTVNSITMNAQGGEGSYAYATGIFLGRGGLYSFSGAGSTTFRNWFGIPGEDGQPNLINFIQPNASTIWETTVCGKGGNAGNSINTGGGGGYGIWNVTSNSIVKYLTTGRSNSPGGGGCGNLDKAFYVGGSGGDGMVRFHY